MAYSEELTLLSLEYTIPLEDAQCVIWTIQDMYGKVAALDWMHEHLARFN
jgi:hypothetical protein